MEVPHQGHEAALRSSVPGAQNKPLANARPWPRGSVGGAPPPPPPKVYRVEPREFRDLVQRLTGAPPTALRGPQNQPHQRVGVSAPPVQPQPVRAAQQQAYGGAAAAAPWFSFPMAGAVETTTAQPQHGAFL